MNDIVANPFGQLQQHSGAAAGFTASRENTEVLALVTMAKRFPRDVIKAADKIRNAFTRPTLAEVAQYQFSRGGSDIAGPSIRAAEAMAQQWGNMSTGWREISRTAGPDGVGISEVEAYCVDYETNNREAIVFQVRHWRDTKKGGYKLTDERDIYELCANQAQRRKRACILAQIPGDVTEMAMQQAAVTLSAKADTSPEGIKKLLDTFASEFGVTKEAIEKRIQRRAESITAAQVVNLKRVYVSLRDGMSSVQDWFEIEKPEPKAAGLDAVQAAAAAAASNQQQAQAPAAPPAAAPAPTPSKGRASTKPAFDEQAYADKMRKCNDPDTLSLMADELRDIADEAVRQRLTDVYRARLAELEGGAS